MERLNAYELALTINCVRIQLEAITEVMERETRFSIRYPVLEDKWKQHKRILDKLKEE